MVGEILQLKPKENAFYEMSRSVKGKLDIVFVCEGKRDAEVLKGVVSKIFGIPKRNLAVTDCEGKDSVKEIAKDIIALSSVSKHLRAVPIIIDADDDTPTKRVESISNSIRATTRFTDVKVVEINKDIFELRSQEFKVKVLVKVMGDFDLPYERHTLDDHILRLLTLEGLVDEGKFKDYNTAKECVDEFIESESTTVKELILNAQPENVRKAFENLVKYLEVVRKL